MTNELITQKITTTQMETQAQANCFIRAFTESDLEKVIVLYQRAFAEPPWNETWTSAQVEEDVRYAQSQRDLILLVAEKKQTLIGFTWGYQLPFEKFPFLRGYVANNATYIDEVAVCASARGQGVGSLLCNAYLDYAKQQSAQQVVLRTSVQNNASLALFAKCNFFPLQGKDKEIVFDPQYPERVYLARDV